MEKIKHRLRLRKHFKTTSSEMSFRGCDVFFRAKPLIWQFPLTSTNFSERSKMTCQNNKKKRKAPTSLQLQHRWKMV